MKKKVLIFALTYYPKFIGGDAVALKEITDRIDPEEMEFDMITLRLDSTLPRQEKIGNINIYRIGFSKKNPSSEELVKFPMYLTKVLFPVLAFFKALSLHRKRKYDLLWGMMVYAGFPIVFFNFFKKKVPILLTLQDGDPVEVIAGRGRIRIIYPIFKRIFKVADYVQAISVYLETLAKDLGYTGPSRVVPNGVDYLKFATHDEDRVTEIKKHFNKQEGDFWLVSTSRLVEKNAQDMVIRALAKLPENVKFINMGRGPDREKLEKLSVELGVTDRAILLDHVDLQDIPNYLKASDTFIRPSRTEGQGVSFMEAMAAGIPVIATTAGGIKDFLFHDETGLEVGIENVDDIVVQVQRLMNEEGLSEKISENARRMIREKYDWEIIMKEMKEVFEKVM